MCVGEIVFCFFVVFLFSSLCMYSVKFFFSLVVKFEQFNHVLFLMNDFVA